jgi:hypothetical protein
MQPGRRDRLVLYRVRPFLLYHPDRRGRRDLLPCRHGVRRPAVLAPSPAALSQCRRSRRGRGGI